MPNNTTISMNILAKSQSKERLSTLPEHKTEEDKEEDEDQKWT